MKKYTCMNGSKEKIDGAIEGTKMEVLEWMKEKFPGIHERADDEMMTALEFFYDKGEIKAYKTADGKYVYLAEIAEDDEAANIEGEDLLKDAIWL